MRLTIDVDLDENELLEAQVLDAVKAEARKVAREAVSKEISAECSRIVSKWMEGSSSWGYSRKLEKQMKEKVDEEVRRAFEGVKIDENLVNERVAAVLGDVDNRIDNVIGRRLDRAGFGAGTSSVTSYIREFVERSVKVLVPETVLSLLVSGMKEK